MFTVHVCPYDIETCLTSIRKNYHHINMTVNIEYHLECHENDINNLFYLISRLCHNIITLHKYFVIIDGSFYRHLHPLILSLVHLKSSAA